MRLVPVATGSPRVLLDPTLRACAPLAAVLFSSAMVCATLLAARWTVGGWPAYAFLAWNLFLAGLPFAFAVLAQHWFARRENRRGRDLGTAALLLGWLLFFPNAPYLVSDLAHLASRSPGAPRWFDSLMFGAFVATGLLSGLASLLLVQALVARRLGRLAGWTTIAAASLLGGFGIYLGRFVRLNSWDVVTRPLHLVGSVLAPLLEPTSHQRTLIVTALYGAFILLGYLGLFSLLHAARQLLPASSATGSGASRG